MVKGRSSEISTPEIGVIKKSTCYARPHKGCIREPSAIEFRVFQAREGELRRGQVCSFEIRFPEIGSREVCAAEDPPVETRSVQVRPREICGIGYD
jgi:hypothetical protein